MLTSAPDKSGVRRLGLSVLAVVCGVGQGERAVAIWCGLCLLRVQAGDDGQHASVVVGGLGRGSVRRMLLTCVSIVCSVMNSRSAIARFECPSAISVRTSRSRFGEFLERVVGLAATADELADDGWVEHRASVPGSLHAEGELVEIRDAFLEQVSDAVGVGGQQLQRGAGSDASRVAVGQASPTRREKEHPWAESNSKVPRRPRRDLRLEGQSVDDAGDLEQSLNLWRRAAYGQSVAVGIGSVQSPDD